MTGKGGKRDPKKQKTEEKESTTFKAAHIKRLVKRLSKMRVSRGTLKAISSAITYIMLEIIDGAKVSCKNDDKKKLSPKHVSSAIISDEELSSLLKNYVIQSGGSRFLTGSETIAKK